MEVTMLCFIYSVSKKIVQYIFLASFPNHVRSGIVFGSQSARKFLKICLPDSVSTDSGWNCTPSTLYFR
jgi:hypothetical protein